MMEWSLPTAARNQYHDLLDEFAKRPGRPALPSRRHLARLLFEIRRIESAAQENAARLEASPRTRAEPPPRPDFSRLRATKPPPCCSAASATIPTGTAFSAGSTRRTCAPPSGARSPRPRRIADLLSHRKRQYVDMARLDFDADGRDEIYFTSDRYAALLEPDDGATISRARFPPGQRHADQFADAPPGVLSRQASQSRRRPNAQVAQSIHDQIRTKEEGLERWLNYDRWPRHAFRLLLFGQDKTQQDCAAVHLEEDAALAGGRYRVADVAESRVALASEDSADWPAGKKFSFAPTADGFDIVCDVVVRRSAPGAASINIGIEVVVNFLAPSAPDRYLRIRWPPLPAAMVRRHSRRRAPHRRRMAGRRRLPPGLQRPPVLDRPDRNRLRIRRRLRAHLPGLANPRRLAHRTRPRRRIPRPTQAHRHPPLEAIS